mmetsp:Transcript_38014/g.70135  ORF Transcript_38014/g.70135 Transcript_38014/m.70135 type:complete len:216 (-) Transcript_38014:40-687(-)
MPLSRRSRHCVDHVDEIRPALPMYPESFLLLRRCLHALGLPSGGVADFSGKISPAGPRQVVVRREETKEMFLSRIVQTLDIKIGSEKCSGNLQISLAARRTLLRVLLLAPVGRRILCGQRRPRSLMGSKIIRPCVLQNHGYYYLGKKPKRRPGLRHASKTDEAFLVNNRGAHQQFTQTYEFSRRLLLAGDGAPGLFGAAVPSVRLAFPRVVIRIE